MSFALVGHSSARNFSLLFSALFTQVARLNNFVDLKISLFQEHGFTVPILVKDKSNLGMRLAFFIPQLCFNTALPMLHSDFRLVRKVPLCSLCCVGLFFVQWTSAWRIRLSLYLSFIVMAVDKSLFKTTLFNRMFHLWLCGWRRIVWEIVLCTSCCFLHCQKGTKSDYWTCILLLCCLHFIIYAG